MKLRHARQLMLALPLATFASFVQAGIVTDAIGDYVPGYAGSKAGDLDVLSAFVSYNRSLDRFFFSGTMAAPIGTSPGGFYVWGLDRGKGTARFAANGISGVLFDSVVVLRPDGTGTVTRLVSDPAGPITSTQLTGVATILGDTLSGQINGALLPSLGFAKADYTWNLWPRDGTLPAGFGQIADFAPDNSNVQVTAVPEPASALLVGFGLGATAWAGRRRQTALPSRGALF